MLDMEEEHKKRKRRKKEAASVAGRAHVLHDDEIPAFKLERSLKSIHDIWKEYQYGLNDKPPLRLLEEKYGTKWRNDTELRTFLRRKKIYEAIECGKSKGLSEEQVIDDLESFRSFESNGVLKKRPLLWLCLNVPEKYVRYEG